MESDLSAVHMIEPKEELAIDSYNIKPVDYDTLVIHCKKFELRSDKILLTLDNEKIKQFKTIVIDGRKYVLEEEK